MYFVVHFPTLPLEHSFMAKGPAQFIAHSRHPAITCQMIKFVKTKKKIMETLAIPTALQDTLLVCEERQNPMF